MKESNVVIPLNRTKFFFFCCFPVLVLCLGIVIARYGFSLYGSWFGLLLLGGGGVICLLASWFFFGLLGWFNIASTGFYCTKEGVCFRDAGNSEISWPPSPPQSFPYSSIDRFEIKETTLNLHLYGRKSYDHIPHIDFWLYRITGEELSSLLRERIGERRISNESDVNPKRTRVLLDEKE